MALNFEFKKSSDVAQYVSALAEDFKRGMPMKFKSWKLNDKNSLELTFENEDGELCVQRYSDVTTLQSSAQVSVILSQLVELSGEFANTGKTEDELIELIGGSDWDATLMSTLFDSAVGIVGRGKIAYQASFAEYDPNDEQFIGKNDDEIKELVAPFIGFGRFPFFFKEGNESDFKQAVDKKNAGKYSDHVSYTVRPKKADAMGLGGDGGIPADSKLFQ